MVEYYSVIKKNEVMPFVATWVGLELIILGWPKSPFEFSYKFQMNFLVNPILSEVRQRKTNII